ncbi:MULTISPECIES: ABC transporter ATP-binding protein [Brucella]|uniref:ABC transporter ATP-binding protein n=1 Tax=Brucella pituitosa TaxID=571256 RepID=A0A643F574_9HYPH|nr:MULTISPECIES: ABC transporter ATP-binding protein [Brucella]PQZ48955.1 ABC transporter ATP-binding protein [Ochrobactrum sp. MYb19]PRA67228.1 ABC transporter ATP-binding protein [Ochrobactrum sp. MYb18]PRA77813.1 ABC transporter ATP-binding protein [Brucella thiophenivorans]PRA92238.1 ABC transporter ATP-binding protein [Ochrobactrum sp. MYb14]PRA99823.1 ABC transporter ATP-binding protein [Ochrobactrum sp. MYb15]
MAFVSIRDLKVSFSGVQVLHGINLDIDRGETLGLVGESGCGKSVTWLAALGLLSGKTSVSGSVVVDGQQLIDAPRRVQESVRGGRIAMIFQDPSSSLNPVKKVGPQIVESLALHRGLKGNTARLEAIRLMERVGIPDAARRFNLFPHEFSGGQCQRIMIAIALAGEPDVLIADEPTTALDVTIQAQILDLLNQIRQETGMAIVFISHDLGAVSQICERVCVMYAGRIVETAQTSELFETPKHPYTLGLFDAIPRLDGGRERLRAIPGTVPDPRHLPQGCAFAPRCSQATDQCEKHIPELRQLSAQKVACFNAVDVMETAFIDAGNAHCTISAEGAAA